MTPRIYLSSPTMHGEEREFVKEAFDTNWVAPLGPNVDAFESEMCEYLGEGMHGAALDSGTAAVHLAVKLAGVSQGDVVLAQSLTFAASVNPVVYEKATPVLIDSEPRTWNISADALRAAFKDYPHPKAVIAVHLYGTPCEIDEVRDLCKEHGTVLIEDAAEALGATFRGQKLGTFGDYGILSFNGNKIITTSGGGMLVAKDAEKIARARFLSTQARDPEPYYQHSTIGYNYRMSNVVAGIGRGQLLHLAEHVKRKKEIYERYSDAFADIPSITMNPLHPEGEANHWLSCMMLSPECGVSPEKILSALASVRIEGRPIWKPMHLQPVYEDCAFYADPSGDVAKDVFERGLCLPSDIKMTAEDQDEIIDIIKKEVK